MLSHALTCVRAVSSHDDPGSQRVRLESRLRKIIANRLRLAIECGGGYTRDDIDGDHDVDDDDTVICANAKKVNTARSSLPRIFRTAEEKWEEDSEMPRSELGKVTERMVLVEPLTSSGVFSAEGEACRTAKIKGAFPAEEPREEAATAQPPKAGPSSAGPLADTSSSRPALDWVDSGEDLSAVSRPSEAKDKPGGCKQS